MDAAFTQNQFAIKRKGLSTEKFHVCGADGKPLFYVEEKTQWKGPFRTAIAFYRDEKKGEELLHAQDDQGHRMVVTDPASGEKLGLLNGTFNSMKDFFNDAWEVLDAHGQPVAQLKESSFQRGFLHEITNGLIPQRFDLFSGEARIGGMRQKSVMIGHQLLVDFSPEAAGRLDHRLGLALAILVAAHQAVTEAE